MCAGRFWFRVTTFHTCEKNSFMKVRSYQTEDFPAVCRVYLDAKREELRAEAASVTVTPLEHDPVIRSAFADSEVLLLECQGIVEGFLAFRGQQLRALFVHGSVRGKGAGSALMSAFLGSGVGCAVVYVARSNTAAMRFYKRLGFRETGAEVKTYDDVALEYLRLEWSATGS